MSVSEDLRKQAARDLQAATALNIAFVGVARGLFSALAAAPATAEALAAASGLDAAYVARWCDAAYAFGYLDDGAGGFALTDLGHAYRPEVEGSLMAFAVRSVLSAHMAERASELMPSGKRLGSEEIEGSGALSPLFGPMLEANFAAFFERQILPHIAAFRDADKKAGLVVDLGCGNGWYLRALARHFPHLRGIGLDGMAENIRQAVAKAQEHGLDRRLGFQLGDIHAFTVAEPADVIAMNRALHHVWTQKESVFRMLAERLRPGGAAVIWEPNWPVSRADLRDPTRRGMAFQNLTEHMQGNHLLRPQEIEAAMQAVGLATSVHAFANGNETVVVGTKAAA